METPVVFVFNGECRPPKYGEWYIEQCLQSGGRKEPYRIVDLCENAPPVAVPVRELYEQVMSQNDRAIFKEFMDGKFPDSEMTVKAMTNPFGFMVSVGPMMKPKEIPPVGTKERAYHDIRESFEKFLADTNKVSFYVRRYETAPVGPVVEMPGLTPEQREAVQEAAKREPVEFEPYHFRNGNLVRVQAVKARRGATYGVKCSSVILPFYGTGDAVGRVMIDNVYANVHDGEWVVHHHFPNTTLVLSDEEFNRLFAPGEPVDPVEMFEPNKPPVWRGTPEENTAEAVQDSFDRLAPQEKIKFVKLLSERGRIPPKFSLAESTAGFPAGTELERGDDGEFRPTARETIQAGRDENDRIRWKASCRLESIRTEVLAIQIRCEAMKAANEERKANQHAYSEAAVGYDEGDFDAMADSIKALAEEIGKL